MAREFVHTLKSGLDVTVEYSIDLEGFVSVKTVSPLGMPQAIAVVDGPEMADIEAAAHEDAWGELDGD